MSATLPRGFAGGERQLLPCLSRDVQCYGWGNQKTGLGGSKPLMLVWADVLHLLSPISDFLWCCLGAAAVAPEIQPGPEEMRALLNSSVVLPCQAEGWPVPQVTWRKDGQLLPIRRSERYEALGVGGTKTWLSYCVPLHISRCFGTPGEETALSPREELCSVPIPAQWSCVT